MKKMVGFVFLVLVLVSCRPQEREDPGLTTLEADNAAAEEIEPTTEQIDAVKKEMDAWAEGRWTKHSATWSAEEGKFFLSATADPSADQTTIKGYCRVMDEIASQHLQGIKVSAAVFFQSGAKIECK